MLPVKDYRFVLLMKGVGLATASARTDPQRTGVAPLDVKATDTSGEATARAANAFIRPGAGEAGRPAPGEHGAAARLLPAAVVSRHGRFVQTETGGGSGISHVPRAGAGGRHEGDSDGTVVRGRGGRAERALRGPRLLLPALQARRPPPERMATLRPR